MKIMFKTELHCHSAEVSACARATVDDIIKSYTEAGYSTIVLTNHFAPFTYEHLECKDKEDWIDKYIFGYEKLREAAQGKLQILLGAEVRLTGDPNDYLLYGVTEEFLRANPLLWEMNLDRLSELTRENGILLIQAHPFRDNMRVVPPHLIDGIEVHNGSAGGHYGTDSRNDIAAAWAGRYALIKTSGTDLHYPSDTVNSGIITDTEITSIEQLVATLKCGSYRIIGAVS